MNNSRYFLAVIGFLLCLQDVLGQYTLNVLLSKFDDGQGFLADGTHCNNFWFEGKQCNIQLKIRVNFPGYFSLVGLTTINILALITTLGSILDKLLQMPIASFSIKQLMEPGRIQPAIHKMANMLFVIFILTELSFSFRVFL